MLGNCGFQSHQAQGNVLIWQWAWPNANLFREIEVASYVAVWCIVYNLKGRRPTPTQLLSCMASVLTTGLFSVRLVNILAWHHLIEIQQGGTRSLCSPHGDILGHTRLSHEGCSVTTLLPEVVCGVIFCNRPFFGSWPWHLIWSQLRRLAQVWRRGDGDRGTLRWATENGRVGIKLLSIDYVLGTLLGLHACHLIRTSQHPRK